MALIPTPGQTPPTPDLHPALQPPGVQYVRNGRQEAGPDGSYFWSNEPANELAFLLPPDTQLVGSLWLAELNRTLLFLAGPQSEIGQVRHQFSPVASTLVDDTVVAETLPHRGPVGQYESLLTSGCLQFQRAHPLSIVYDYTQTDLYVYLADGYNPDRIIHWIISPEQTLSLHTDSQVIVANGRCGEPVYYPGLDCVRCQLDTRSASLGLTATAITTGGSLPAGVLVVRGAYCTATGERLTDFMASTGPVSIWENAQSSTPGSPTSQCVTLTLEDVSTSYTHIQLAVLQLIGGQASVYTLAPIASTTGSVVIRGTEEQFPLSLSELLQTRTHYEHSLGLTLTDNRLLRWGLTEKAVPNLQRFLLDVPVYWQTIRLPEGAYKDGLVAEKFRGYMRDEVVALGIQFVYDDGDETGVFHLPGRASLPADRVKQQTADGVVYRQQTGGADWPAKWQLRSTATLEESPQQAYVDLNNPGLWDWGKTGYWQSTETYPNRPDVWGPLCGTPIRHHKLPDSSLTHIHSGKRTEQNSALTEPQTGFIFPLGFWVDNRAIATALQTAETAGVVAPDRIVGWKIVRADRTGQASILGRGLLYSCNRYSRKGKTVVFPNYPFNDQRPDPTLSGDENSFKDFGNPATPLGFTVGQEHTFHSPDGHFSQLGRGSFLQLETEEQGIAIGQYVEALDQARQKLETPLIRRLGLLAGAAEASSWLDTFSVPDPLLRYLKVLSYSAPFLELLKQAVPFVNVATQYVGVGHYDNYQPLQYPDGRLHGIVDQAQLTGGIQQIGSTLINNRFRESTTYVKTRTIPAKPRLVDSSRWKLSEAGGLNKPLTRPISAYYTTLKRYAPAQYGRISAINYLETGGVISRLGYVDRQVVFGGDTFINRFSFKRKHAYFTQTRHKLPDGSSVNYSQLANVAYPQFYYNTEPGVFDDAASSIPIGIPTDPDFFTGQIGIRLDNYHPTASRHQGYIPLYSYGIPYFFTESAVNLDYRMGGSLPPQQFYPNVDPETWTQESEVPITTDNVYTYDSTYSKAIRQNRLITYPESQLYNQLRDQQHPNRIIFSRPGNFRQFLALDSHDFDRKRGLLRGVDGLDGGRVLARFDNGSALFNAYAQVQTGTEVAQLTTGALFATRPQWFATAEGGLLGSQHAVSTLTPYGLVWTDQKRGSVYTLTPGEGPQSLTDGPMSRWLATHLPSRLEAQLGVLPARYHPILQVYDPRQHRLILTKKDTYVKAGGVSYNGGADLFLHGNTPIAFRDPAYFVDCSVTLSYHFPTKSWSFLGFVPDWYLPLGDSFISGLTAPVGAGISSGWLHRSTPQHYTTFYNQPQAFELVIWTGMGGSHSRLMALGYGHDVRQYHTRSTYSQLPGVTYDRIVVSTDRQSTGLLSLSPYDPRDTRTLLTTEPQLYQQPGGSWSVNGLWDKTRPGNTLPLWVTDASASRKWVNPQALTPDYSPATQAPIAGHGFYVWLSTTNTTAQFIHQWIQPTTN